LCASRHVERANLVAASSEHRFQSTHDLDHGHLPCDPDGSQEKKQMTKTRMVSSGVAGVLAAIGYLTGPHVAIAGDQWIEACADPTNCFEGLTPQHVEIWAGGLTPNGTVMMGPWNSATKHWDGHLFLTADADGVIHYLSYDVGPSLCNKWLEFRICDKSVTEGFECLFWGGRPNPSRAVSEPSYVWVPCS
jgi:hypothetical protein